MRALAHSALVTSLDDAVKKEKGLEPLVLQLKPFPFLWLLALDLFESMVKSADGSVLLKIFSSDAEVNPSHTLTSTTPARPAPQPPPPPPRPRPAPAPRRLRLPRPTPRHLLLPRPAPPA